MGARTGGSIRSQILLTAIVVAAFVVVAVGNGIGPAYATCHEGDGDADIGDYDTYSDCFDDSDYEDDGNYKCSEAEKLTDDDMDGDGTDDCEDPDDDGDNLSDRLERVYMSSGYRDKNSDDTFDDDGLDDGMDIVPTALDGATATATPTAYSTGSGNDCGDGVDRIDPVIPDGEVEVSYGKDDLDLLPPEGWEEDYTNDVPNDGNDNDDEEDGKKFEDGHWHERPNGKVGDLVLDDGDDNWQNGNVTENVTNLPDDVTKYPSNGNPRITLRVGLIDHDTVEDWHERIDVMGGGGTIAEFEYRLTNDDPVSRDKKGDGGGSCDATLGFDFSDSADKTAVRAAVYHRDNARDPVVQAYDL